MRYEPFSEDSEVIGIAVLAFIRCVNAENIKPYLEKYNLTQIDPHTWYPTKLFCAVLSDMADAGGAMFDFVSIGMKLAELVPDMPGATFTEKILQYGIEGATNRGSDTGYTKVEVVDHKHVKITQRQPSPDDLLYGVLYGYAKRYLAGKRFTVKYDENVPRRDQGGDVTIIHVTWD
jgi:hypothetical protein